MIIEVKSIFFPPEIEINNNKIFFLGFLEGPCERRASIERDAGVLVEEVVAETHAAPSKSRSRARAAPI